MTEELLLSVRIRNAFKELCRASDDRCYALNKIKLVYAEKREGWLKPQIKLKTQRHGGNGMINRLVNNRIREPGK